MNRENEIKMGAVSSPCSRHTGLARQEIVGDTNASQRSILFYPEPEGYHDWLDEQDRSWENPQNIGLSLPAEEENTSESLS